jgi:hypothetical protein
MKIEVTPVQGTAQQFTVTVGGYRLALSDTKDNATQVANTLRKGINRSGRTKKNSNQGLTSSGIVG